MTFSDLYIQKRIAKNKFLTDIDKIINWDSLEKQLHEICKRGLNERGTKAYNPLLLFKMQLISVWYNLSDVKTEETVSDSLSLMCFCGLKLEDDVPDHSTLSRFRTELTEKKAYDRLLRKINQQLAKRKLIVKAGVKVDASLTESPFSPKGKPAYEIAEDRQEDQRPEEEKEKEEQEMKLKKQEQPGSDTQARWLKKGGKSTFGYKKHMAVDENGMILSVHSTTANEHDSKGLEATVKKIPKEHCEAVYADKGYQVPKNKEMLAKKKIKNRIMHKAYRNRRLSSWQERYNGLISKSRWVVERTFGSLKRWFGSGVTGLKGLSKTHGLHVLEAIAHNLKRSPGLVYQMAKN